MKGQAWSYPWAGLWGEQHATSTVAHLSLEAQGAHILMITFFSKQAKAIWEGSLALLGREGPMF